MIVTEAMFAQTIDKWSIDVRVEAIKLFRDGVSHDRCVNIAIAIVEGKDVQRLQRAQRFGV